MPMGLGAAAFDATKAYNLSSASSTFAGVETGTIAGVGLTQAGAFNLTATTSTYVGYTSRVSAVFSNPDALAIGTGSNVFWYGDANSSGGSITISANALNIYAPITTSRTARTNNSYSITYLERSVLSFSGSIQYSNNANVAMAFGMMTGTLGNASSTAGNGFYAWISNGPTNSGISLATAVNGIASSTTGTVATSTNVHTWKFVYSPSGTVQFYQDSTLVATSTTNIPTSTLWIVMQALGSGSGGSPDQYMSFSTITLI